MRIVSIADAEARGLKTTGSTAFLVLQRAGGITGLLLNVLGAVQSSRDVGSAWIWVAFGTALLLASFGSVLLQQQHELATYRVLPQPNVRFERPRPAFGTIQSAAGHSRPAYFVRAEFVNVRQSLPPTTSLERPHVRIRYYREGDPETDADLFALVREGRIAESPERFDPMNPSRGVLSIAEATMNEVRVGQSLTVDLLIRVDGETTAHTWSNEGGSIGQRDFLPGTYVAVIEIEGDNLHETVSQRVRLTVPEDPNVPLSLEPSTATSS